MRKRLTAGLAAMAAALAFSGASPASAQGYHDADDRHPPVPCNPYPPGKKFHVTAAPASATIRKGTNIDIVAVVTRGTGSDEKPCKYHVVILRDKSQPGKKIKAHRTGERGTAAFVAEHVNSTLNYYFDLLYNDTYYSSNVGVIHVR